MKSILILIFLFGVIGCSVTANNTATQKKVEHQASGYLSQIERTQDLRIEEPSYEIKVEDDFWVSTEVITTKNILPHWAIQERDDFVSGDAKSLGELIFWLRKISNLPVSRSKELIPQGNITEGDTSLTNAAPDGDAPETTAESTTANQTLSYIQTPEYRVNLRDVTFKDVLDAIAERMGIHWEYTPKKGVQFFYFKTKRFQITKTSSGGSSSLNTTTGSSSTSDSNSSESQLISEESLEPDFWNNTVALLQTLTSPQGELSANQATGDIIVRDNPQYLEQIENYITDTNRALTKTAYMKLTAMRVVIENSRNFDLNLDFVYDKANSLLLNWQNTRPSISGVSSLTGTLQNSSSDFNTTRFFIDALSTQGRVTTLGTKHYVLRNHSVININKGDLEPFLNSFSSSTDENDTSTTDSEIQERYIGFGLTFKTQITNDNRAVFNILFDQTDSLGDEIINLSATLSSNVPRRTRESFRQEFEMRNGQSQVLLAIDNTVASNSSDSPLGGRNCLAGCNNAESFRREYILYVMTSRIK